MYCEIKYNFQYIFAKNKKAFSVMKTLILHNSTVHHNIREVDQGYLAKIKIQIGTFSHKIKFRSLTSCSAFSSTVCFLVLFLGFFSLGAGVV